MSGSKTCGTSWHRSCSHNKAMKTKVNVLELKVLYEICRIIGQVLKLDQALESILAILSESLAMNHATITLKDEETGHLVIRASHGMSTAEKKRGVYHLNEGVTGLIFRTAQPFVIPDISKEPLFLNKTRSRVIDKERISYLGVPIVLYGSCLGVLSVDRLFEAEISFEEDIHFLSVVATLVAQFINLNRQVKMREEELRKENISLRAKISEGPPRTFMVGRSPSMIHVQEQIKKVSPSRASVLLLGESGTGKTLVARIIHELSAKAGGPFVKINCASLPENLLESELFGYEKGAFTGASRSKAGRFEEADGGTIFLDEIGELSLSLQAKLLRFLQDREFERLGSVKTRRVEVRVIAATNKDLSKAVAEGTFREDLFYRLNVFPVQAPPLRERKEDIPYLVNHFLERTCREYGRKLHIAPGALELLSNYDWPGNVREMENLIERLVIMVDGSAIHEEDLPACFHEVAADPGESGTFSRIEEMERREVLAALDRNGWIQSHAARDLGLTMRQIGYRIKKFGLDGMLSEHRRNNPGHGGGSASFG